VAGNINQATSISQSEGICHNTNMMGGLDWSHM